MRPILTVVAALALGIFLFMMVGDSPDDTSGTGVPNGIGLEGDPELSKGPLRPLPAGSPDNLRVTIEDSSPGAAVGSASLAGVSDCIANRDQDCVTSLIDSWFLAGPEGIEALLLEFPLLSSKADAYAAGLLLHAVMLRLETDPDKFLPWDQGALIGASVGFAEANYFMSGVLVSALLEYGGAASATDFDVLLRSCSSNYPEISNQIDLIRLLGEWTLSLPESEMAARQLAYLEADVWNGAYGSLAGRLFLRRDVASGLELLTDQRLQIDSDYPKDHPFGMEGLDAIDKAILTAFGPDQPMERAGLLRSLDGDVRSLSMLAMSLPQNEANDVLGHIDASFDAGLLQDFLAVKAGNASGEAALERILSAPDFGSFYRVSQESIRQLGIQAGKYQLVHDSLVGLVGSSEKGSFDWDSLMDLSKSIDDREAMETIIVPWLYSMEGDSSKTRTQLAKSIRTRFSDLSWVE